MDIDRAILKALLNGNHVLRFSQMYVVIALKYHMFYWSSSYAFCYLFCLFFFFPKVPTFRLLIN